MLLALGLVACGGGDGASTAVENPATAATQSSALMSSNTATPLATTYSVANLSTHGWAPAKGINGSGQITFNAYDAQTGANPAFFYNGNAVQKMGLPVGSTHAEVRGINDSGQVVGYAYDASGDQYRAFSWRATDATTGVTTDLGPLGGGNSFPQGINNSGQVAGYSSSGSTTRAFSWSPAGTGSGVTTDLGTLGGASSAANGINHSGQVVGSSHNASGNSRAFAWSPTGATTGTMIDLGTLGGKSSFGHFINDLGQVTGYSSTGSAMRAFSWSPTSSTTGVMTDLGTLGGSYSFAAGINNSGHVVGYAQTAGDQQIRAFAWSAVDGMIDLGSRIANAPPGLELYQALAIADNGSIVASSNVGLVVLTVNATVAPPPCCTPPPPPPPPSSTATPVVGPITLDSLVAVGSPVTASAGFTDADKMDTHTAVVSWGDGSTTQTGTVTETTGTGTGTATATHTYSVPGVYQVTLTVTDNTGKTSSVTTSIVVFDPSAGFVTGGGWITSPLGAYKKDESLTGRATFGFVSKYLRGATKPSGSTEFQFHAAKMNFHSGNYEWLVVAGARAQYKGSGTINGTGDYKFLLTAIDANLLPGGGKDRFRIKIWHYDAVRGVDVIDYDNQSDASSEGSNTEGTLLGGGSIVIHK